MEFHIHYILSFVLALGYSTLSGQNVGINDSNSNPDPSAMLDVQSTSKGMLVPRMNTGQRTGISNAAVGLLVFDTDSESFWYNTSSGWVNLSSDVTVDNTLTGNGTAGSPLGLAQNGASDGQVLSWNGTSSSWEPAAGLWLPNGNNIAYANRNVGIGLNNPQQELQVKGDIVAEEDNSSAKGGLLMTDSMGVTRVHLNHIYSNGETQLRFEILVPDTLGTARVEFFRNTKASSKKVEFYRGKNFGTARSAVIGVDGENSFFQIHGGNLGIGTDTPSHLFHVNGVARSDQSTWATSSDFRVKTNITPISDAISVLNRFNPVTFNWKKEYADLHPGLRKFNYGFIAQEVELIIPEMVTQITEKVGSEDIKDFRVLNTDAVLPLLVKGIQEQQMLLNHQKQTIELQQQHLEEIEKELFELKNSVKTILVSIKSR